MSWPAAPTCPPGADPSLYIRVHLVVEKVVVQVLYSTVLQYCTHRLFTQARHAAIAATISQEHSLACVQYYSLEHIGKAAMAAMVATKPKV